MDKLLSKLISIVVIPMLGMIGGCSQTGGTHLEKEVIQGITMVTIPSGSFRMGYDYKYDPSDDMTVNQYHPGEQPVHTVSISSFQIGETEITQKQYLAVMSVNPSTFKGNETFPVTNIGADDALQFCNKLSEAAGFEQCYDEKTGKCDFSKNGFRLPTEAEWEYACRAVSQTHFNTGDTLADLNRAGWYINNSGGKTHPVKQKEPNSWGLHDMHGNVFEFCYDGFSVGVPEASYKSEPVTDPTGYESFNHRIMRGGGWFSEPSHCRSATRSMFWSQGGNYYIGFRIARRIASVIKQ